MNSVHWTFEQMWYVGSGSASLAHLTWMSWPSKCGQPYSWFTWAMWKWNIFKIITRVFLNDKASFFLFLLSFPHWCKVVFDWHPCGQRSYHLAWFPHSRNPHTLSLTLCQLHHVPSLGAFNLVSFQTISPHSRLCNKWFLQQLHHMVSAV